MTLAEIKAVPIPSIAARDCHLFLWTTTPHLVEALEVMKVWGFRYSTVAFVWIKTNKHAPSMWIDPRQDIFTGMGYTTRQNAELVLLGRRGSPPRLSKKVRQVILAPRREHSRKPEEVYERVIQYAEGPRLDMFSRENRPGFTAWGDQVGLFDLAA